MLLVAFTALSGTPAESAPARVEPGSALASGQVLGARIVYGGFTLPVRIAGASASYQDSAAQASSQGVDAGTLGASATSTACSSGGGSLPSPTSAPPFAPLVAASAGDGEHKQTSGLPIGTGEVEARPSPLRATATTDLLALTIPGLLRVSGTAAARVSYDDGRQRNAAADVGVTVTLGAGLVTLTGLSWEVAQHGGRADDEQGAFALAKLTVAGRSYQVGTPDQLAAAVKAANAALKVLGVALVLPERSRTGSTTSVSPLIIRLSGSPLLASVIRPLLKLKAPVQELLAKVLAGGGCSLAQLATLLGTTELVVDVLLAALSGEGALELQVGGVQASTAPPPQFQNPFAGAGEPPTTQKPQHAAAPGGQTSAPVVAAPVGAPPAAVAAGAPLPGTTAEVVPVGRIGCISTNTADHRRCSAGADPRLLSLLLVVAVGLFAADLVQSRRRQPLVRRMLK